MSDAYYLGIEIGGTKLQLGVGSSGGANLVALERREVVPARGKDGILQEIRNVARKLTKSFPIRRVGIGFGGPIDAKLGMTVKSHQVAGWEQFPLVNWVSHELGLDAVLGNDADLAGLAEATIGAGRGCNPVFYVTVGTGIGGGLIIDGAPYVGCGHGAAEIGHLRPGLQSRGDDQTVESLASGPGMAREAIKVWDERRRQPSDQPTRSLESTDVLFAKLEQGIPCTGRLVGEAADAGSAAALAVLNDSIRVLGWAIAQVITLTAPQVVVVGGGVSLIGERLFFAPLRKQVDTYVFPPYRGTYQILPARLGEEMVVHGAIALAASADEPSA